MAVHRFSSPHRPHAYAKCSTNSQSDMRSRRAAAAGNHTGGSKFRVKARADYLLGLFIAVEGIDGSGKSTIAERLVFALLQAGYTAVLTREPGGTAIGEQIRAVLFGRASSSMDPTTEMMLFAAARAQLVSEVIRPALADGATVVTDRFSDSS